MVNLPHAPTLHEAVSTIEKQKWLVPLNILGSVAILLAGVSIAQEQHTGNPRHEERVAAPTDPANRYVEPQIVVEPLHALVVPAPRPHLTPRPVPKPRIVKPKPALVPKVQPSPKAQKPPLPRKNVSYGALRRSMSSQLDKIPSLPEVAKLFPESKAFSNYQEQLAHIEYLREHVSVTVEDFRKFKINTDYIHAFDDQKSTYQRIQPRMEVLHWSGDLYPNGVKDFITGMHSRGLSALYFTDRDDGQVYQLLDSPTRFTQTAKGANLFSQSDEMEGTGTTDITVAETESAIKLAVHYNKEIDRSPSSLTILGHYAVDLLYANTTYDGKTGTFHTYYPKDAKGKPLRNTDGKLVPPIKPYIDKFDLPQEYMALVIQKSQELAAALNESPAE